MPSRTWRFPSDVHHLYVGAHLQQCFQELVSFAVEGAREHFRLSISVGKFGHTKRRQRGELSVQFLRLRQKHVSVKFSVLSVAMAMRTQVKGDSCLQSVVFILQVFDAESLGLNLLSQQRRVDHLDART